MVGENLSRFYEFSYNLGFQFLEISVLHTVKPCEILNRAFKRYKNVHVDEDNTLRKYIWNYCLPVCLHRYEHFVFFVSSLVYKSTKYLVNVFRKHIIKCYCHMI